VTTPLTTRRVMQLATTDRISARLGPWVRGKLSANDIQPGGAQLGH
jgi:hypothetical protein